MPMLTEKNLQRFLDYCKISAQLIAFKESVMQSEEAKKLVKKEGIVVKNILLLVDDNPLLCILLGERRINLEKIKKLKNVSEARLAKAKEVLATTGYDIGGVPPFGHLQSLETVVDEEVKNLSNDEILFTGGGSHHHLIKIKKHELMKTLEKMAKALLVADIKEYF